MMCLAGRYANLKGHILLEALLVIVVLSVGLTVIIRSFLTDVTAADTVKHYFQAESILDNAMFEVLSGTAPAPGDTLENTFFQTAVTAAGAKEDGFGAADVRVDVSWPAGTHRRRLTASTLVFKHE